MAGAMQRAKVWFGFADEDDRYDDYDEYDEAPVERPTSRVSRPTVVPDEPEEYRGAEVTPLPRRVPISKVVGDIELGPLSRITTIHPRTYNEAKNIGEAFREGTPVIMNLTDLGDADAKRLVDFAAGLVFGLQGAIERVTNKVFLLSPAHVEVTTDEGEQVKNARGLFNQS